MWVFPPSKSNTHTNNIIFSFFPFSLCGLLWPRISASAMTGISQIILDYNARLISSRARSCIINLTVMWLRRAQWRADKEAQREKKRKKESLCRVFLFFFYYVYSGVFFSSLCIRMSVQIPPSWIIQQLPPPTPGPNPRLCVAVVPVRLQGSGLLHRAGRCHCHTHISVISPVIFLQWNYSKSTKCRCIDLILFSFLFFVRCLLRKMPLYRLPGVPWHLMAFFFFFTPLMVCSDLHCSIELIVILLFIHILRFPSKMCEIS